MKRFTLPLFILTILIFNTKSFADKREFTLVNDTGKEIRGVYISPSGLDQWSGNVLYENLLSEDDIDIEYNDNPDYCSFDIKIIDKEGNYITWEDIDICKWGTVTISFDGVDATVTFD